MTDSLPLEFPINSLAVVGVGLIGGSIASAARQRRLARQVIGWGRSSARIEQAADMGIVDRGTTDLNDLRECELVVVCTPVAQLAEDVRRVLDCAPAAVVCDVGSVKASICQQVGLHPQQARFVGSHPLAGSEKSGFEHADPELFSGRVCVVTPTPSTSAQASAGMTAFWQSLGMTVRTMSPEEHDDILAHTSHMPHLAAAAIALQLAPDAVEYAATGFRDTTRIASGDPKLWASILMHNRSAVVRAVQQLTETLSQFRGLLDRKDAAGVLQMLDDARQARELFLKAFRGDGGEE